MNLNVGRLILYGTALAGLGIAIWIGSLIGSSDFTVLALLIGVPVLCAWIVLARDYWWLPMPFALGIGGMFYVPFKIYPNELALVFCFLGLLPQLIIRRREVKQDRPPLPVVFYVLASYLVIHYLGCLLYNYSNGIGGPGNVSRAYMNAVWPFIFGYAFYKYGSTRYLRQAIVVSYLALTIRLGFGLLNYFLDDVLLVPAINYTLDPQDLRASGGVLMPLAALCLIAVRNQFAKLCHAAVFLISLYGLLLGGSRSSFVFVLLLPLQLCLVLKRWILLSGCTVFALVFVLAVNTQPDLLDSLPFKMQRAVSVVLLDKPKIEAQEAALDSNEWHRVILPAEGYSRWSQSIGTVLFGTGIRSFIDINANQSYGADTLYYIAKVSADMGAYESTFWSLLAVTGLTSMVLYSLLLIPWFFPAFMFVYRHGIHDAATIFVFTAAVSVATVTIFCVFLGSFPSESVYLMVISIAAISDWKRENLPDEEEARKPRALLQSTNPTRRLPGYQPPASFRPTPSRA